MKPFILLSTFLILVSTVVGYGTHRELLLMCYNIDRTDIAALGEVSNAAKTELDSYASLVLLRSDGSVHWSYPFNEPHVWTKRLKSTDLTFYSKFGSWPDKVSAIGRDGEELVIADLSKENGVWMAATMVTASAEVGFHKLTMLRVLECAVYQ